MADLDDVNDTKEFHVGVPERREPFFLKGSGALDWGMQNRLARIFRPDRGRTVMLAIDHGYFQGPTTGPRARRPQHRPAAPVRRRADAARAASCARRSRRRSAAAS